jgi:serine/threonine protein phosphatase 1
VLERVWQLQDNPAAFGLAGVTVLMGNHEQMLLEAMDQPEPEEEVDLWEMNGGNRELVSFAAERRDWFEQLPVTAIRSNYLFVHAGVRPGIPLEEQDFVDLIWIRQPFLSKPHGLPYTVVHGHTFRSDYQVTWLPYRIGIDTGAYESGILTALRLERPATEQDKIIP